MGKSSSLKMVEADKKVKMCVRLMRQDGLTKSAAAVRVGVSRQCLSKFLSQIEQEHGIVGYHAPVHRLRLMAEGQPSYLNESEMRAMGLFVDCMHGANLLLSVSVITSAAHQLRRMRTPDARAPSRPTVTKIMRALKTSLKRVRDSPAGEVRDAKATPKFIEPYFDLLESIMDRYCIKGHMK